MTLRDQRTPRKRAIVFTGIVGACLVLLAVGRSEPAQELRRGVHYAVSPIQAALAGGTRSVTQVLGAFAEIDAAAPARTATSGARSRARPSRSSSSTRSSRRTPA